MMRWLTVVVVLGLGSCAFDSELPEPEPAASHDIEHIVVVPEHTYGVSDQREALPVDRAVPSPASDPCQCTTNECLQDWADKNFGCDLCVTIVCNGGPTHICTLCDADGSEHDNGLNHNQP